MDSSEACGNREERVSDIIKRSRSGWPNKNRSDSAQRVDTTTTSCKKMETSETGGSANLVIEVEVCSI